MPLQRAQLDAEVTVRNGGASLALIGDLDLATAARCESLVLGIARIPGVTRIDVDCRGVAFVDSAGLHALLRARATSWRVGVQWFIGPTSPPVRRLLALTGFGPLHDASMN